MEQDVKPDELRLAVSIALQVHDAALRMNHEAGFPMFSEEYVVDGFIAALEAQDPPFTVAPLRSGALIVKGPTNEQ